MISYQINPEMLIRYWVLLIIVPLAVGFFILATIACLTILNHLRHSRRERNAAKQAYREDHDALGQRLPPTARGFCTQCETLTKKAFFLPDGTHLCEECYDQKFPPRLS